MITGIRTLAAAGPGLAQPDQYDVGLRPGTSPAAYAQALGTRLGSGYMVILNSRNSVIVTLMLGLIGTLTLLLALVAGLYSTPSSCTPGKRKRCMTWACSRRSG